jgi:hypothetical protein
LSLPRKYPPQFQPDDWNAMVDRINGYTPSGIFKSPYTFLITQNIDDGVEYYAASNAFQTVYGGSTLADHHNGGVDGVDASAVIQAALNIGGAVSLSPDTVYSLLRPLQLVNNLDFYGPKTAVLKAVAAMPAVGSPAGYCGGMLETVPTTGCLNIQVHGFSIDSNNLALYAIATWDTVTQAVTVNDLELYELTVSNPVNTVQMGFIDLHGSNINMHDCNVSNVGIINLCEGSNNRFNNNFVTDTFDSCISCGSGGTLCENYTITGNTLRQNNSNTGYCIDIFGRISNVTITGNTLVKSGTSIFDGIHFDFSGIYRPTQIVVSGNTVNMNSVTTRTGISVSSADAPITITGNTVTGTATTGTTGIMGLGGVNISGNTVKGFQVGINSGETVSDVSICNNTISGSSIGIQAGNTLSNSTVNNNTIYGLAGATTRGIFSQFGAFIQFQNNTILNATYGISTSATPGISNNNCIVMGNILYGCTYPVANFTGNANHVSHNIGYTTKFNTDIESSGIAQTIPHGLQGIPSNLSIVPWDTAGYALIANIWADATNIYFTAGTGHWFTICATFETM